MKVYLDVCCLCRPFDDQTSYRIRMEAEAVIAILNRCATDWELVGSEVIDYEIARIVEEEKMKAVESLLQFARERVMTDTKIVERARLFHELGIDTFDALHLASAESAGAVLLTTDDSLVKVIKRLEDKIPIAIYNPVQWLMEVTYGDKDAQ
ncbi:PIN domain-containing protein [Methanoculleus sp. FWC-SCC1]|uniref:PIN domain-containing protein n=1 Tax=Methanoculleus frigidifontis TaxID=2584085 RepID=A0ABT8MCP9_9EURY|nr:PIN domain-containing protein [Methanoculleus sp. FWC-SCC1]MDN7025679.1 PIN domain-containing protein [Methanoculleus sp. FWC-SCC1]